MEKRKNEEEIANLPKKFKTEDPTEDIYRTGAKCVGGRVQDLREKGLNFHTPGALRTKPGRGDPTISMSCSDKIAKWLVLGIQGSLVNNILDKPIYLNAIVISKYSKISNVFINF
jgi:tRNA-specific adenosine deaminase 1